MCAETEYALLKQRYLPQRLLQSNAGHSTFQARDQISQETVILKQLHLAHLQDWSRLDLFEREVKTLASLDHPRIPRLRDHFQTPGEPATLVLVQELIVGQTLSQHLQQGLLNEAQARDLAEQILQILIYLQSFSSPVIHRDLKPDNLMLDAEGRAYLIDFGAVRDSALANNFTVAGTFGYMPPEQAAGQVLPATDLYALGLTLVETLSGVPPHELPQDSDLRLDFRTAITVSPHFLRWLEALTEPLAEQRPATAAEALHLLQSAAPAEAVERLRVTVNSAEKTLLTYAPQNSGKNPLQWLAQAFFRQALHIFIGWLCALWGVLTLLVALSWILGENNHHTVSSGLMALHPFTLCFLSLCWFYGKAEYLALSKQDQQPQQMVLDRHFLFANGHAYDLRQLQSIDYRSVMRLSRTHLIFRFSQGTCELPIRLSPREQKFFRNCLDQHLKQFLEPAPYQKLKNQLL